MMQGSIQDKHAYYHKKLYGPVQQSQGSEVRILRHTFETYKREYPYIDGYEYKTPTGQGDLRVTDGQGRYAVFEAKYLRYLGGPNVCVERRRKKHHAEAQAKRYLDDLRKDTSMEVNEAVAYIVYNDDDENIVYSEVDTYYKEGMGTLAKIGIAALVGFLGYHVLRDDKKKQPTR